LSSLLYTLANINEVQLPNESLVTLAWQCLCETVCWHIIRREPIDLNSPSLGFLSQPALVDINVPKLCSKLLVLFGQEPDGVQVVTMDGKLMTWIEPNMLKEPAPQKQDV
jgi:hypothetical protein